MTTKTNKFAQVREFQKGFNLPAPDVVTEPDEKLVTNRANYIMEELVELLHAISDDDDHFKSLYHDLIDEAELTYHKQRKKSRPKTKLIGVTDAYTDISYFGEGGFCEIGLDSNPIFNIVHQANMGKLFPDGKPHYNQVGKVIKPDNWEKDFAPEPLIEAEIKKQKKLGESRFNLNE